MPSIKEIQNTVYDWVTRETITNTPITGTVEVFSSSPFVVGTGTLFTQEVKDSTFVSINGLLLKVASVSNDTNLTLEEDYPGLDESGLPIFTGVDAILQDQNFPRPNNQYISILISPLTRVGRAWSSRPDSDGVSRIIGNREFTVLLQCYGQDSIQILSDLRDSLEKESVIEFFCESEIANAEVLLLTDISQLLDSMFEPRAALDLLFRTASDVTDIVDLMKEIQGEGQYESNSGEPITRPIQAAN